MTDLANKALTGVLYSLDPTQRVNVEFYSEEDVEERSKKLYEALSDDIFVVKLKQLAWEALNKNSKLLGEFGAAQSQSSSLSCVSQLLEETQLREVVTCMAIRIYERNMSLHSRMSKHSPAPRYARRSQDETIECIRDTRVAWEQGIKEEVLTILNETKRPFTIARPSGKINPLLETNALQSVPRESVRFLFDSEDLLETCASVRSPNLNPAHLERRLGLIKVPLNTPNLQHLIGRYPELAPTLSQYGLDETYLPPPPVGGAGGAAGAPPPLPPAWCGSKFCNDRHEQADAISSYGSAVDARLFLRRGCPPSCRGKIWRAALALPDEPDTSEESTFQRLRAQCDSLDLLTDELYLHDVQNVTDDPRFFVFEEEIKECVLCFARDGWVRENSSYEIHKPILGLGPVPPPMTAPASADDLLKAGAVGSATAGAGAATSTQQQQPPPPPPSSSPPCSPPSAVQPFLGLAIYFAPLCYVLRDRVALYSLSRQLWVRLWCKLNVISGDPGTLMHVCATFENLLFSMHPKLFLHCLRLGVQPLQIALPWIQLGFVGLLECDQILHLWDRVIGYQDPTVLAVMAVGVFLLRAEAVLCSNVAADVAVMLAEGSRLRVVPILQLVLFSP